MVIFDHFYAINNFPIEKYKDKSKGILKGEYERANREKG
jgi:hypothetical protein